MGEPLQFPDLIEDLKHHVVTVACPRGQCLYCRSRREIERLRAALEKIADPAGYCPGEDGNEGEKERIDIALAALHTEDARAADTEEAGDG